MRYLLILTLAWSSLAVSAQELGVVVGGGVSAFDFPSSFDDRSGYFDHYAVSSSSVNYHADAGWHLQVGLDYQPNESRLRMQGRYWLSFLSTEMEMTDYHHDADPVGDSSIYTMESVISNDFRVGHASLVVMFEPVETDNWKVAIGGGFVVPAGAKLVSGNRSGYSISCADTGVWNCDTTDLSYHGRTGPANFGSFGPAFSVQLERTLAVGSVYLSIDAWTGLAVNSWLNLNEWTVEYRTRGAKVSLGYIFRPKPKDREFLLPIEEEEDDESEEETKDEEEE